MKVEELSVKAAKILANCPRERIPMIANLFKDSGVVIRDEDIKYFTQTQNEKKETLKENRANMDTSSWLPTKEGSVLRLREAFMDGISMTALSKKVGVHRTSLYKYMRGASFPTVDRQLRVMKALDEMGVPKLDDDEWEIDFDI